MNFEEFKQQVMEDLPEALPERLSNAEINPLQTEKKELKEIKKCVLKVLPDAELSLNPMRATITDRMQEAKKKKKEMQVQRDREPRKQGGRK